MLRTIVWFFCFGVYLIGTLVNYVRLIFIRKHKGEKEADTYACKIAKNWADFCIGSSGAKVEIIGLEHLPEGNCLFVGNHQGYLDIPLVFSQINKKIGFIAKKELEKAPILSTWMKALHCVFMDRDNPREAIKSINEGINYLDKGYSLVIFPEGTRSKGMNLGEFKKGSMKLGLKSKVPIVPITIIGSYKVFEESNRIKPAAVKVIISEPILVDKLSKGEQNNLSETIKESIKYNLEKYK